MKWALSCPTSVESGPFSIEGPYCSPIFVRLIFFFFFWVLWASDSFLLYADGVKRPLTTSPMGRDQAQQGDFVEQTVLAHLVTKRFFFFFHIFKNEFSNAHLRILNIKKCILLFFKL